MSGRVKEMKTGALPIVELPETVDDGNEVWS